MDIQSLNASQLRERTVNQGTQRSSSQNPGSERAVVRSVDGVELSEAAQTLREASGDKRVPFDQSRVDAIRQAISQGRYHIDPERLASNFMRIEYDILQ